MKRTIRFDYTGDVQIAKFSKFIKSIYIQAYGAKGGGSSYNNIQAGNGGNAYGTYTFTKSEEHILYLYIGGRNGWNGGGSGGNGCGGGATDIRLVKATDDLWYDTTHISWDTDKSLLSRIVVAGAGGGCGYGSGGMSGGGLSGQNGGTNTCNYKTAYGGTQTSGGAGQGNGGFGYGGNYGAGGGGGAGWYGGGSGGPQYANNHGGAGGSSYINLLDSSDRGTTMGVNDGNGYILITYEYDTGSYFFEKDGLYYLPIKEFYDKTNGKFVSVSIEKMFEMYNNSQYLSPDELNKNFDIDGEKIIPTNIMNFEKCRLCSITDKNLVENVITYTPSATSLSKANINLKLKEYTDNFNKVYTEIESIDVNKNFNIDNELYRLYDISSILTKINIFTSSDIYKLLDNHDATVYKHNGTHYVYFRYKYNYVMINRVVKEKITYSRNSLETF